MELTEFFRYGFLQRALIAGSFIGILCSTLGVFLVLRRFSLIGDGLAHATFGSVALALLLKMSPLYVSIPIVMICSVGILRLTERARLYGDAAIGVVSSLGIAGGVMLSSLAGGFNIDLFSYLFGSILSISESEVFISIGLSIFVILMIILYYNELLSITFDEDSAKGLRHKDGIDQYDVCSSHRSDSRLIHESRGYHAHLRITYIPRGNCTPDRKKL